MNSRVIIVGAGLSGLAAAGKLEELGYSPLILEASHEVGGRIHTERHEGFLLDVGFQVLLNSYPELSLGCKADLNLRKYVRGATYRTKDGWKWIDATSFLEWDKSTWSSLYRLAKILLTKDVIPHLTVEEYLQRKGIPPEWTKFVLGPFIKGVFLEKTLGMPASRFLDLFPYFVYGNATLPALGMQALPQWYAKKLKKTEIRFNTRVSEVSKTRVVLSNGAKIEGNAVLLALSQPELSTLIPTIPGAKSCSTCCDYFALKSKEAFKPILYLDGRSESPVNNFSFLSAVQSTYAPKGMHLISTTSIGPQFPRESEVRGYLSEELKLEAKALIPLKRYVIDHALPLQSEDPSLQSRIFEGCFIAGETVDQPSINGSIYSGKKTALALHDFILS